MADKIDKEKILRARDIWYGKCAWNLNFDALDREVYPFLNEQIVPKAGWLKRVREALMISTGEAASRAGLTRSAWVKVERREVLRTIRLDTLQKLAEALDCELVYAIRPKRRVRFSELIWSRLADAAIHHPWVQTRPPHLQDRALAAIAGAKMNEPQFRKKQKWSERRS